MVEKEKIVERKDIVEIAKKDKNKEIVQMVRIGHIVEKEERESIE